MIETVSIPNWTRWEAKEQQGVNRGYAQAYINEKNAGHRAFLQVYDPVYSDSPTEYRTITQTDAQRSGFTGYDQERESFDSQAAAEDHLRDFMTAHACERDENSRTHIELVSDVRAALIEQGLVPQHDADIAGWTQSMGSTGFSLRPLIPGDDGDGLETTNDLLDMTAIHVHLNIDGKESGLSYSEWTERDSDGECRALHKPNNPERLCSKVEAALREAGFNNIRDVRKAGHQTHWDYDVGYSATVAVPTDLKREVQA